MSMLDPRVKRWAQTLTHYCLDVQPGDDVSIVSTPLAASLIQAVYREILLAGGNPVPYIQLPELRGILTRLDDHGIETAEVTVHTPDLDDVFLTLTGN